ncbi:MULTISPECIES: type II toxin-antitoxin system YafQ family toxin [Levilactobacillus]|jgi:mRNA interferase YafQ|uniref:type II toxin-antitoxin system RelE/ParE family toxin n=1 Tax=Levilactobacillus TaxID=2767886 RepID=UPI00195151E7|nr:type II toxin-antitoxin system mRNA interferase toxin, RelE/StbE family [Levilactobacillus sp. 244-2]
MYQLSFEPQFLKDFQVLKQRHPELIRELRQALWELQSSGRVPAIYKPHILVNRGGNYNGYFDFHLADGKTDVLVLYAPHKTHPKIRMMRIGSHQELFQGKLK